MKVLILTTTFPRWKGNGIGNFVFEQVRSLSQRVDLEVLTPDSPGSTREEDLDGVRVKRFTYFYPRKLQRVLYPDGIPDQLKKSVLAWIGLPFFVLGFLWHTWRESKNRDIVLCNWALTGIIAQTATALRRCVCVVIVRGSDMKSIEKNGLLGRVYLRSLKKASAVCVVARGFVDLLKERGVENVQFTPNGVDYEEFTVPVAEARERLALGEGKIVFYAGSLIERKGVRFLIEAMTDIDAKLVVAGEGGQKKALSEMARERGVDAVFLGQEARERMRFWFSAADVFVLPSLYEGRPNVLIEALAAGTACVATDIKGTRELIQDGVSGFLVPPGEVEPLRRCVAELVADDLKRRTFAEAGQAHVRDEVPSWSQCAADYGRILEESLGTLSQSI